MSGTMDKLRRIQARNKAWFPEYRASHEVYCDHAKCFLSPDSVLLHLGAGRDSLSIIDRLAGSYKKFVSLDRDREGLSQNKNRDRILADGGRLPFKDESFDLIMADNVFEHLDDPLSVLYDCHRCLKVNGALVFLCPNRFNYIALLGSPTPHWFHAKFKWHTLRTAETDTFPTYYRLNSVGRIMRVAQQAGFKVETIRSYVGWPTYWEFSDLLHRFFVVVHRCLEALPPWSHISLVGVLRRGSIGPNR